MSRWKWIGLMMMATLGKAQEPANNFFRAPQFRLFDVRIAKLVTKEDQPMLSLLGTKVKTETRTRRVTTNSFRVEARTRAVMINGKKVEQVYRVRVPVATTKEVPYTIQVPVGNKITMLAFSDVKAWNLAGEPISIAELKRRLTKPVPVVLLQQPVGDEPPVGAMYRRALSKELVLIFSSKAQPEMPLNVIIEPKPPAAPAANDLTRERAQR